MICRCDKEIKLSGTQFGKRQESIIIVFEIQVTNNRDSKTKAGQV